MSPLARDGLIVDALTTVLAIGFTYLFSGPTWAGPASVLFSVAVGLPCALLRRAPAIVTAYLAGLLVVCNAAGWFGGNAVQLLLTISLVATAHKTRLGLLVPLVAVAGAANLSKLAASTIAPHPAAWSVPVAFTVGPVVFGFLSARRGSPRSIEAIDMVLGVSGAMLAVVQTWPDWSTGSISAGILPLAGLLLAAARRFPWSVLLLQCAIVLVMTLVGDPVAHGTALPVLVCLAVGVLAGQAGHRAALAGAVLVWPVVAVVLYRASPQVPAAVAIVLSTLPVCVAVAVGCFQHLRLVAAQRRTEAAEARARATEREQIAREVHDVVAHHIAAIAFIAGAVAVTTKSTSNDPVDRAIDDIRRTARCALDDLRSLLDVLRDAGATPAEDLIGALREMVGRVRTAGIPVGLEVDPDAASVPLVVRAATLRIVQECLTNVLKHGGAEATVVVEIRHSPGCLTLRVVDTGSGGKHHAAVAGNGIHGMGERARALGGRLASGPRAAEGWYVEASIPTQVGGHP